MDKPDSEGPSMDKPAMQKDQDLAFMQQLLSKLEESIQMQAELERKLHRKSSAGASVDKGEEMRRQVELVDQLKSQLAAKEEQVAEQAARLEALQARVAEANPASEEAQLAAKYEELRQQATRIEEVRARLANEPDENAEALEAQLIAEDDELLRQAAQIEELKARMAARDLPPRPSVALVASSSAEAALAEKDETIRRQAAEIQELKAAVRRAKADAAPKPEGVVSAMEYDEVCSLLRQKERELLSVQRQLACEFAKRRTLQNQNIDQDRILEERNARIIELEEELADAMAQHTTPRRSSRVDDPSSEGQESSVHGMQSEKSAKSSKWRRHVAPIVSKLFHIGPAPPTSPSGARPSADGGGHIEHSGLPPSPEDSFIEGVSFSSTNAFAPTSTSPAGSPAASATAIGVASSGAPASQGGSAPAFFVPARGACAGTPATAPAPSFIVAPGGSLAAGSLLRAPAATAARPINAPSAGKGGSLQFSARSPLGASSPAPPGTAMSVHGPLKLSAVAATAVGAGGVRVAGPPAARTVSPMGSSSPPAAMTYGVYSPVRPGVAPRGPADASHAQ